MRSVLPLLLLALAMPGAAQAAKAPRPGLERMAPVLLNGKPLPFSEGVRVGDMLYLSGQIGTGSDGTLPPDMAAQAKNVLDRITASLAKQGLGWKDTVRCLVMLKDMADWPAFNAIYAGYVDSAHLPARSAFGATGLALGALVEVQCDAYIPAK